MAATTLIGTESSAPAASLQGTEAAKVVLGAGIGMALSLGPVLIYTFGTFLLPIVQDTGWPRAVVAAAAAPTTLIAGLLQPFVGWFVDRYGPRVFALCAFTLFSIGLVGLGLIPHSVASFAICFALMGVFSAGLAVTGFSYIVASRFSARRGLALGIVNTFTAASAMLMPAIATLAIARYGWRLAYVAIGIGVAALGTVSILLVPRKSHDRAIGPDALRWTTVLRTLARNADFWWLVVAFACMTSAVQGTVIGLVPMLVDRGYTPTAAAGAMGAYGMTMLFARFVLGTLLDHWTPRLVAVVGCLGPLVACFLLLQGTSPPLVLTAAALLGVGASAESDLLPYITARLFGRANLGQKIGVFIVVFGIGASAGVLLFARVRQIDGSYANALLISAALMTLTIAIFALLRARGLSMRGEPHALTAA